MRKQKRRPVLAVKPKTDSYSLNFTKDELMYLSLAIRAYQNGKMVKAWDMERGATQRLQSVAELAEKAAVAAERIGTIIENRLLGALEE